MSDALKQYKPETSGGLFATVKEGEPIKIRVLTTDPIIHNDKFGNTRFAFVVWSYTENKAQILDKGWSIAGEIQKIHLDEDFGADIQKVDVKISATGQGKDTRYSVNPLPTSATLTNEQIEEVKKIDLPKIIGSGVRMSEVNSGTPVPKVETEEEPVAEEPVIEDIGDEPVDLSEIPF